MKRDDADGGRKKTCYKINYNFPVDEAFSLTPFSFLLFETSLACSFLLFIVFSVSQLSSRFFSIDAVVVAYSSLKTPSIIKEILNSFKLLPAIIILLS